MSEEVELRRKMKKAAQLLLIQRHRAPGVKGWELKRSLGRDYLAAVRLLREDLERYGLDVKAISEDGSILDFSKESDADGAKFFIVTKEPLGLSDVLSGGWRIDDLACLAAGLAYVIAHRGKAPRKDLEKLLNEKFPKWRTDLNLDRFIRWGYLNQEGSLISIGWRSRAEVDEKTLLSMILAADLESKGKAVG